MYAVAMPDDDQGAQSATEMEKGLRMVRKTADRVGRSMPLWEDREDLIQWGCVGLMEAMQRFDPGRGVRFETYAYNRILGAIRDGLRQQDWATPALRRKNPDLEPPARLAEPMTADRSVVLADLLADGGCRDPLDAAADAEVRDAVRHLPGRERYVVEQVWLCERTRSEVARALGISVSRVSQLEGKALKRLRQRMAVEI